MSATNTVSSTNGSFRDALRGLVAQFRAQRGLAAERARVRFELMQYSDRELADMGLSRGDVDTIVASVRG